MDITTFLELLALTADHFDSKWELVRDPFDPKRTAEVPLGLIRLTTKDGVTHCPASAVAATTNNSSLDIYDALDTLATALNMHVKTVDQITRSADYQFYFQPCKGLYKRLRKQMLKTVGLEKPSE